MLQTQQNLKINNLIFSPKCFSFYAIIKEKSIKTLMGSTEGTQFLQIDILSLHI